MLAVVGNTGRVRPGGRDNSGNLVHSVSALRMLDDAHKVFNVFRPFTDEELEFLNTECSHFVYIAANMIRLGTDSLADRHRVFADNLMRLRIPVVVFGLGAQAPTYSADDLAIPEDSKRLVRLISDMSVDIAVRGEFTADVLEKLGATNTVVTGCQSAFWRMTPEPPEEIAPARAGRVIFGFTGPWKESSLINRAIDRDWECIGQTHWPEEALRNGEGPGEIDEQYRKVFEAGLLNREAYLQYIGRQFYKFYNLDEWINHLRGAHFALGTRFHGNMAALHAGVPALWITHDSRTRELCDHLGLPQVSLHDATEMTDDELLARTDYAPYLRKYAGNYATLFDYLERAGIRHLLKRPTVGRPASQP